MQASLGSLVVYATAPNTSALGSERKRNSVYTQYLVRALKTRSNLSVSDMLTYVTNKVAGETNNQQIPWQSGSMKDIFCFSRCGSSEQQAAEITRIKKEQSDKIARRDAKIANLEAQLRVSKQQQTIIPTPTFIKPKPVFSNNLVAGKVFRDRLRDGNLGPKMVVIPAGSFRMGDIQGGGYNDEKPVHTSSVEKFAMSKYEVAVGDFKKFVNVTGYKTDAEKRDSCFTYKDEKWSGYKGINWRNLNYYQNNNHPAVCISFNDAIAYAKWLSQQTGEVYRLPTEAEWEYAARAGTETLRYWGNDPDFACSYANVHDNISKQNNGLSSIPHNCTDGYVKTAPVGSFKANQFGLFDMLGNVWEWTCSEYEKIYNGKEKQCVKKSKSLVMRSSSWFDDPETVRSANRDGFSPTNSFDDSGFRLVRILTL
jgi:formylglycine-generating enzyme required for sulfatase activity